MTIDEAKEIVQTQLDSLIDNPDVTLDPKYIQAELIAIASLEAWDKIKQEINDLFSKPAYYMPNYDAYKMLLDIIDKHIKEVEE